MTHRVPTVRASREAHAALRRLVRTVGPLVIVQSAGCCDGSAPMVLPAEDFPLGAADVQVGDVDGVPVFISARELNAWAHGDLELDVQPGYADGFSLAPSEGMHFISSSTACPRHTEDNQSRTAMKAAVATSVDNRVELGPHDVGNGLRRTM